MPAFLQFGTSPQSNRGHPLTEPLTGPLQIPSLPEMLYLLAAMLLGAILGHAVRAIYRRYGVSLSDRNAFGGLFPLLTVATVLVISVIKSSLALSLGLVGALSIVRFRAAIKEPEEIVYLFFCIALGIALAARVPALAIGGLATFTLVVAFNHRLRGAGGGQHLLLTIAGHQDELPAGGLDRFTSLVAEAVGPLTVQRLDVEQGEVRYRVAVSPADAAAVGRMMASLQARLPGCRISYVNLKSLL
jgi:hypothetical protein